MGTRNRYLTSDDFAFARFRANGTLDPTFSGDGLRTVHFGGERSDSVHSIDIQRDGRILAAGASGPAPRMAVTRLTTSAAVDTSFGRRLTRPGTWGGYANAVLEPPDGRILVAGRAFEDPSRDASDWVVARYGRRGALDGSWGGDGIVRNDFGTGADSAAALAVQTDGRVVVGGAIYASQGLARYHAR